jgi:hypothetical protein
MVILVLRSSVDGIWANETTLFAQLWCNQAWGWVNERLRRDSPGD